MFAFSLSFSFSAAAASLVLVALVCSSTSVVAAEQRQQQHGRTVGNKHHHRVAGARPPPHRCFHDDPSHREILDRHLDAARRNPVQLSSAWLRPGEGQQRLGAAQAVQKIRIVVSDADLKDPSKYCTKAGESIPDFRGGTTTCRTEDIFTDAKRDVLTKKVLPAAIELLQGLLLLAPTADPIVVPSDACPGLGITIPADHSTSGVANADYVLYVAAPRTPNNVLAFAGGCGSASDGRMVYGRAAFGPEYLVWSDSNPAGNDDLIKTAVHEIVHALGMSWGVMKPLTTTATRRGKSVTIFTGAKSLAAARAYYNCPTMTGVELEDEGQDGTKLSHPDKRLMAGDFMSASGGTLLSRLSVSMLADLADYTVAEDTMQNTTYGLNAGCGFINEKCNTAAGGRGKFFCFDDSVVDACNFDYTGSGYCGISTYSSELPSHFQYFSGEPKRGGREFYDRCPITEVYSNRRCNFERTASHTDYILGFTFSRSSRCFRTTRVARTGFADSSTDLGTTRCLISRCQPNGKGGHFVQFQINGSAWIDCAEEGKSIGELPGYEGTVTCPHDFSDFCFWYPRVPAPPDGFPEDFVGLVSITDDNPFGQVPLRSGAIEWILGEMVFIADKWHLVAADSKNQPPAAIVQSLQRDSAGLFGMNIRDFYIKSAVLEAAAAGSTAKVLRVGFTIGDQDATPDTINSRLENVRTKKSTAWLGRTRNAYQLSAANATDSPRLSEYKSDYALSYLERLFLGLGVGPFSGVVVAAFIVVCIIVAIFFCCCRDACCPNKSDSTDGDAGEGGSASQQQQQPRARRVRSHPKGYKETAHP